MFSITTLVQEVKSVILKKDEYELRKTPKLTAFGHCWTIRIPMQQTYRTNINRRIRRN